MSGDHNTNQYKHKPWAGLTEEEVEQIVDGNTHNAEGYQLWCSGKGVAEGVEAKLKEKNTTLNQIRSKSPCADGWVKLLKHLGKTQADDEPLSLTTILDSNGLEDALWCLQAVDGHAREIRLYTVWCARQVQHLTKDQRSIDALDVAERFANGQATKNELDIAGDAAGAARAAAWAPWAARAAARAAAGAAWAVAGAPWAVAGAAWSARDAAGAAARAAQEVKFREMFCDILETKELKEKNT